MFEELSIIVSNLISNDLPVNSNFEEVEQAADYHFEKLQAAKEPKVQDLLLCWSLYEAVNIHNCDDKEFEQQKTLQKIIIEKLAQENVSIKSIKKDYSLLKYLQEKSDIADSKNKNFISYCMFADKDYILNGNAYWREINLAVLEKVYIDSLNALDYEQWHFPQTTWLMNGGPISFGPDYTQGPHYKWDPEAKRLLAEIYLPLSDHTLTLASEVNPVPSAISIEEACDWVHLDFIIKIDMDRKTYPRLYKAHTPGSCRRAIDLLFQLVFGDLEEKLDEREIHNFVFHLFTELWWVWTGERPKPEFGYLEAKPALVYCMYKVIPYLRKTEFDILFEMNPDLDLKDEYLRFKEMQEKKKVISKLPASIRIQEFNAHKQEKARYDFIKSESPENSKIRNEKQKEVFKEQYAFLSMMFYFLLWDIGQNCTKGYVPDEKILTDFFLELSGLMEKFYAPFTDESWNKEARPSVDERPVRMEASWIQEETYTRLINEILKMYKINTQINSFSMYPGNTENYEKKSEVLRTLIYNFSHIKHYSRDSVLNVMDFVGEQRRRRNLFCQPDRTKYYKTWKEANDVKNQNENNQIELQSKDCGFEIDEYLQMPIPNADTQMRELMLERKLTCRLLNDTDKTLTYEVGEKTFTQKNKDGSEKEVTKYYASYTEDYRKTYKNNLYRKVLYFSERNSARHYLDCNSLTGILNDRYPINLLYAFIDARDFFYDQKEKMGKDKSNPEIYILQYHKDFVERHLLDFAEKFELVEEKDLNPRRIWKALFNKNKNLKTKIKNKLNDCNYEAVLGKKYMAEIKWFFKKLFYSEPEFIEMNYPSIAAYLTYLALRMDDYVK